MANKNNKKNKSPLIGSQAKPTVLDKSIKLDIDTNKTFVDNIIDAGISNRLDANELSKLTTVSNDRDQVYQLIDTMCQDSAVSSVVRTFAEDTCEVSDNGHIVWAESDDPKISKFVNYLLNVVNVDKQIFGWAHSLIKYGDLYLKLFRESDYKDPFFDQKSIENNYNARNALNEDLCKKELAEDLRLSVRNVADHYSYHVEMVSDPSTMFELVNHGVSSGYVEVPNLSSTLQSTNIYAGMSGITTGYNYRLKTGDINIYQADDYVHAFLQDNVSRFPETIDLFTTDYESDKTATGYHYEVRRGKSMLYDSYKTWREKQLLEASILLNRVTRSSIIRKVAVEVGDMSKEQAQQTLKRVKELFEQKTAINKDKSMTEYTNPGAVENFIYYATHNGQGQITVDSVGGDVNVKDLADLDNWVNKFYAGYGIPKQFFGYCDDGAGFNGGSSLTITSSVYAKGVGRIKNALIQAISDMINLFLLDKGCRSYLNQFSIKMKPILSQEEKDYRENLTNRISAISNYLSLFSDIENKERRLRILKTAVKTLNYDADVLQIIDEEIKETQVEAEKAKQQEQAEAKETADTSNETDASKTEAGNKIENDLNLDSSDLDLAPMPESIIGDNNSNILQESNDLTEITTLPTPEELNENKDFSSNL